MIKYIIISVISYFIGTVPWALLLVRLLANKNVLNEGSGNVGAMNSFDITGKKWIAILVFVFDALKGFLAVYTSIFIIQNDFFALSLSAFFVVLGHNFNVFLKFKGGRGLSTACGALLYINPAMLIPWGLMWLFGYYLLKKDVHIANATSLILTPFFFMAVHFDFILSFVYIPRVSKYYYFLQITSLCVLILISHIKPLSELYSKQNLE
jgi:glycerol-3-phosphate acyltransferase PlsY